MNTEDIRAGDVANHLKESAAMHTRAAEHCADAVVQAADMIAACFSAEGKLLICGNGGSAADSQHMAAEFTSRLTKEFERPGLPAVALTTDTSFLTAYANDIDFHGVFARQVQALGKPGDVLLGISTSGNSENVVRAFTQAKELGVSRIALMGAKGKLADMADIAICVPSDDTQLVQESHLSIEHMVCHLVESRLFRDKH